MCFYNDYDWTAEVNEETEGVADTENSCIDCSAKIIRGEWRRNIVQQEHEECQQIEECGHDDDDNLIHDCERDKDECNYGENFECDICQRCDTIRKAILKVEISEGCDPSEGQPALGELKEQVDNSEGWLVYIDKMRALGLTEAAELAAEFSK
jgi:hypothetical protein